MPYETDELKLWVGDARRRTIDLITDLDDEQLLGPSLAIVNPPVWEAGHQAWFQEKWVLREGLGRDPIRDDTDVLYDSMAIAHDDRWQLPLPSLDATVDYLTSVRDQVVEALDSPQADDRLRYLAAYTVFHEDMHAEAFIYTRQTLGWKRPTWSGSETEIPEAPVERIAGDAEIDGGSFALGATKEDAFVFDNEKWAHDVTIEPFAIARAATTQSEFAAFVDDDGYRRDELWSDEGRRWREREGAEHPLYWRRDGDRLERRHFTDWVPLEADLPVVHVNYFEVEAFCNWAGRRLPTEAEWEVAAATEPSERGFSEEKRRYPWGDIKARPPAGRISTASAWARRRWGPYGAGDSGHGVRQMIGNVWEWTSTVFGPYPGFAPDMYKEYSEPWFKERRRVLRGGAWASRGRMLRNTWRNFFTPERRDVFAGFRTCAR